MSHEALAEDQSHYEISLTAGQAFVAFVLLLLSLAVTFAFGLMIGKSQPDDHLMARKEPAVITERPAAAAPAKRVEQAVTVDDFQPPPKIEESVSPKLSGAPAPSPAIPAYAQLLTTADQKTAEGLAAKLIDGGFTAAYVERTTTDKGPAFRVRVKFASDNEARSAEGKLRHFAPDVWITR
ncbi:MAG: hypothetical protein DMF57_03675 [Acidobacteria bacterium]|nr:MAG: hypothetical protein DMF57_03675 [Acidobacteriota bacterium]